MPPRTPISYGGTFVTRQTTRLAVLPCGYGDSYPRVLSGNTKVLIHGQRVSNIGRICMDQFMVDVTDLDEVKVGDEAILIGRQGSEEITVEEIADLAGTITNEILTAFTSRVPKIYK